MSGEALRGSSSCDPYLSTWGAGNFTGSEQPVRYSWNIGAPCECSCCAVVTWWSVNGEDHRVMERWHNSGSWTIIQTVCGNRCTCPKPLAVCAVNRERAGFPQLTTRMSMFKATMATSKPVSGLRMISAVVVRARQQWGVLEENLNLKVSVCWTGTQCRKMATHSYSWFSR